MTEKKISRRNFIKHFFYGAGAAGIGGLSGLFSLKNKTKSSMVWQIDPEKCSACGRCEDYCVLTPSVVKCIHSYQICGYCDLCSGYLRKNHHERNTAAENLLCPTAAIKRTYIEDPYYEYVIDEKLCIACGKCVKACSSYGNDSLFLQIKHDICVNCNQCNIAKNCPSNAVSRVSADSPYIIKKVSE